MDPSAIEADTPSPTTVPSNGMESQPKVENDAVPSSSGASRSPLFKAGMVLQVLRQDIIIVQLSTSSHTRTVLYL